MGELEARGLEARRSISSPRASKSKRWPHGGGGLALFVSMFHKFLMLNFACSFIYMKLMAISVVGGMLEKVG